MSYSPMKCVWQINWALAVASRWRLSSLHFLCICGRRISYPMLKPIRLKRDFINSFIPNTICLRIKLNSWWNDSARIRKNGKNSTFSACVNMHSCMCIHIIVTLRSNGEAWKVLDTRHSRMCINSEFRSNVRRFSGFSIIDFDDNYLQEVFRFTYTEENDTIVGVCERLRDVCKCVNFAWG